MAGPIITVDSSTVVASAFARAAHSYDEYSEIFRQTSERMLQRLPLLAAKPGVILDLGCGSGADLPALRKRYPGALVVGQDLVPAMLRQAGRRVGLWRKASLLAADAAQLPFRDGSIDLVLSNMLLPWCQEPPRVFDEIHRVLAPGGTVLFTTAGPDTLAEYRELWRCGGSGAGEADARDFGLADMHDLGDSMLAAGFSAPVLDRENLTVSYPSVAALEAELRNTGTVNVSAQRRRGLMSPALRNNIRAAGMRPGGPRFSVTIELVQGHGWKSELPGGKRSASGDYQISLDSFRQGLGQSRQDD